MLAQILHDLYIPGEVLNELPEDQKQLLFCKMREEQVRRYHQREQEDNVVVTTAGNTNKTKKQVTFRLGADGNEWCWVMGESPGHSDEQCDIRIDNDAMETEHSNEHKQIRTNVGASGTFPMTNSPYYTVHRDERKQIGEISSNIQEARRIFARLESETRRLVLSKENQALKKQQYSYPSPQSSQSDNTDEIFYREIEERAKKVEQERREAARRARDYFHSQPSQFNVCFDTNNQTTFALEPMKLNSSKRTTSMEKKVDFGFDEKVPPKTSKILVIEEEPQPVHHRSPLLTPITRADIRQWFCINEIPYGAFRSSNGQIYPWFHGIISRPYTEQLLYSKPIGSYLIRISEKMFGYVLSYHGSDHCRHLLIEVTQQEHAYRFLGGTKKELFQNFNQLIEKYSNSPIRSNSTDVLSYPCGQHDPERADYADLFVENDNKEYESLYISLDTTTSSLQSTTHL